MSGMGAVLHHAELSTAFERCSFRKTMQAAGTISKRSGRCGVVLALSHGQRPPSPRASTLTAIIAVIAISCAPSVGLAAQPSDGPKPDPIFPFSREIETFAKSQRSDAELADATLFIGSSSIRLWDTGRGFPDEITVNRGFGGATTPDVLHYYDRIRPRVAPQSIIVYVGENDLTTGATPEKVARDVLTLLRKLRRDYPAARLGWLSLKPSPIRWTIWPKMQAVNVIVAGQSGSVGFDYLDAGALLLADDGLPDASLFRPDGLHMNARGYVRWNRLIAGWMGGSVKAPAKVAASTAGNR